MISRLTTPRSDLSARRREPEWMDDPRLDEARHIEALEALARVNALSRAGSRVLREAADLGIPGRRPLRVLDVACGGGDVLRDVARRARRAGLEVELHGCDVSSVVLEHARRRSRAWPEIAFHRRDALAAPLADGYDLATSSLFLHHLSDNEAVLLLRRMALAAPAVLVQDLHRTRRGLALTWLGLRVLTRSPVARVDGPRSVRAAFTPGEVRGLAARAGLEGARVRPAWPQRWVLRWRRS